MSENVKKLVEAITKRYEDNKVTGKQESIPQIYRSEANKRGLLYEPGLMSEVMVELNKRSTAAKKAKKTATEAKKKTEQDLSKWKAMDDQRYDWMNK